MPPKKKAKVKSKDKSSKATAAVLDLANVPSVTERTRVYLKDKVGAVRFIKALDIAAS